MLLVCSQQPIKLSLALLLASHCLLIKASQSSINWKDPIWLLLILDGEAMKMHFYWDFEICWKILSCKGVIEETHECEESSLRIARIFRVLKISELLFQFSTLLKFQFPTQHFQINNSLCIFYSQTFSKCFQFYLHSQPFRLNDLAFQLNSLTQHFDLAFLHL